MRPQLPTPSVTRSLRSLLKLQTATLGAGVDFAVKVLSEDGIHLTEGATTIAPDVYQFLLAEFGQRFAQRAIDFGVLHG